MRYVAGLALFLLVIGTASAQTVAFTQVNVIPMDTERVLRNQTVLITDGIITALGPRVKVPKNTQIIDGKGKYLIPGLTDMHVHLFADGDEYDDAIAPDELRVMVANGVTTVRFMIGTPQQLILREQSAKGAIVAPTIYAASPHLTGREQGNNFVVTTPEQARAAVRQAKTDGYDFIKVTTFIEAAVYEAAVDEAAKQNIRVVGHADSRFVGVERAFKAKQQIEHLDGYLEAILADGAPMKGSISDLYIYNPKNWDSLDFVDEKKIASVARATVAANPYSVPTQHFMKNTFGLPRSEESIRAQPDFRFYPPKVQEFYINYLKRTKINEVSLERRARWIDLRNKLITAIHDAGGKIMAGSDTPEFLWLYGFSLHRELKALREAGLSNFATLQTATVNPAQFLGTAAQTGTIAQGKRADLVLLEANPLDDIAHTEKRAGVMLKGKYYTQTEMNQWLNDIAPKTAQSYHEKLSEEQAAGTVADALFAAMRAKDAAAIRANFLETGQLTALDQPRNGTGFAKTRHFTAEAFAKLIAESQAGELIERMPNKEVKIYGNAAVVFGRYTFHVGEKFSHCGTNAFHLLKTATGWKIANASSTLEFANCDAASSTPQSNSNAAAAQDTKDAQATVEQLFTLMTAHKPNDIIALHTPEAQLAAYITARDGKTRTENLSREGFAKFFETKRAEIAEKMYAPQTRVFGDLALVYGRYIFTVNQNLAHCGMNAFHLIRTAEGWKLGHALSTIEPNGCTAEEKTLAANPKSQNRLR